MMPNHPSDEQIKEWEEINFLRETQSHQWFITTGQPLNLQHEIWLKGQEKLGSNGQLELLSVGLSEPNVQTNENTEPIPLEQEISQAPLEAGFISPQPQHGRLPAGETRDPSRSSIHVRPTQENVRRITMLTPTCNTFGLLATLNAKVDQSYISKDAIHRIALERHIKKTQFPKYLKTQGEDVLTDEVVKMRWTYQQCHKTTKTEFYIAPSGFFDGMLGRDVLDAEKSEQSSL